MVTKSQNKRIGENYLHNHPEMEMQLNIPRNHVIVDRKDWEEVVKFVIESTSNDCSPTEENQAVSELIEILQKACEKATKFEYQVFAIPEYKYRNYYLRTSQKIKIQYLYSA